jgi:hypothetical protein
MNAMLLDYKTRMCTAAPFNANKTTNVVSFEYWPW